MEAVGIVLLVLLIAGLGFAFDDRNDPRKDDDRDEYGDGGL
jgi:hypothetical protein